MLKFWPNSKYLPNFKNWYREVHRIPIYLLWLRFDGLLFRRNQFCESVDYPGRDNMDLVRMCENLVEGVEGNKRKRWALFVVVELWNLGRFLFLVPSFFFFTRSVPNWTIARSPSPSPSPATRLILRCSLLSPLHLHLQLVDTSRHPYTLLQIH